MGRATRLQREGQWFESTITQFDAGVVELADTPDLGSGDEQSCGFKSCHPYKNLIINFLEEWLSGLRHWFAKSAYNVFVPWVQIPFLPAD